MPRSPNDFYQTPKWQVDALKEHQFIAGVILEPCAGDGSIAQVLDCPGGPPNETFVYTNDIDRQWDTDFHCDATLEESWKQTPKDVEWIVTNPPFNGAFTILRHAYSHVGKVALLLRLSFLEPTKERGLWLSEHPPDKLIILPRWSYTKDGKSDSVTTAWMIWDRFNRPAQSIVVYPKKPKREKNEKPNRWGNDWNDPGVRGAFTGSTPSSGLEGAEAGQDHDGASDGLYQSGFDACLRSGTAWPPSESELADL